MYQQAKISLSVFFFLKEVERMLHVGAAVLPHVLNQE